MSNRAAVKAKKMSKKKRLSKRTDQPEKRAEREPVVGIEPTANGLQIRFRLSIPSNPGLFRAEKQDRVSTEVYQNLPISIGVAVNGCCQTPAV